MIGSIGASGAGSFEGLTDVEHFELETPYGAPSAPVTKGVLHGKSVCFLPRHGEGHKIPPHQINYRANLWALKLCGVEAIVAFNAVGSIHPDMRASDLAMPNQIIDYTWGREHTYFDGGAMGLDHVDFTVPYDDALRSQLAQAAQQISVRHHSPCVYAATQGPRLESAAEIIRLERDGADVVGMTGMPEAGLARELGLSYASICIVSNLAAGKAPGELSIEEIFKQLDEGVSRARKVFDYFVREIAV